MEDSDAAASAILAVFPTIEAFSGFSAYRENAGAVKSFSDFAFARGLIDTPDPIALEAFIRAYPGQLEQAPETGDLNFEALVEQKARLLEFNLSMRALVERVNSLIAHHRIELPGVSNSMLSRLKKETADTPHKCNTLRSLAFWIGHERPHLGRRFHYETLLKLCRHGRHQTDHKEGVRIGFALYSRGDVIDHEIVGWLKKNLKAYIEHAISRFSYGKWGKVRSQGITTLYVDFPKEAGATNPAAYRQCLRSAVSLAHQMAIRWSLSAYCTQNRFLSIGIAAGEFTVLDNYLLPVLNTKLAGDPVIRLTDYARQCVLINDIRLLLCREPAEITLFSGETLTIWWVEGFWSALYFDFVPDLLKDPVLANDADATEGAADRFWISSAAGRAKASNAVSAFLKFPQNSLLGLEIAKTLYYRRRFWEAMEILRIVLSLDSTRLNARTLRMVLLRNLAVEAPSHEIAAGFFVQAEHEAAFIQKNCAFESEEFYCEYAVLYLARAMSTLGYMRRGGLEVKTQQPAYFRQQIFADLDRAESLFTMGVTVSPTGIRSVYLLSTVRVLRVLLQSRPRIFETSDCPVDGNPEEIRQEVAKMHRQFGYLREDLSGQATTSRWLEEIFSNHMVSHDDSIALQAYRPTTYFCAAVTWWDLFPVRTVRGAAKAVELLEQAAAMAASVAEQYVCIYAFTRTYGEMMPAVEFIEHMHRGIRMIREQAGQKLSEKDGAEVIASADAVRSSLLMTLNY
ncbi:MAG: hypothetical protein KGY42_04750 [Desulfobacterales bacterium]|nr:hypothetical protein [Desulfobacterales bacterium]MBS3754909.1 hypothetical protein [Desulfobacterales bacterium]